MKSICASGNRCAVAETIHQDTAYGVRLIVSTIVRRQHRIASAFYFPDDHCPPHNGSFFPTTCQCLTTHEDSLHEDIILCKTTSAFFQCSERSSDNSDILQRYTRRFSFFSKGTNMVDLLIQRENDCQARFGLLQFVFVRWSN